MMSESVQLIYNMYNLIPHTKIILYENNVYQQNDKYGEEYKNRPLIRNDSISDTLRINIMLPKI